ncbi:metallophosphoesterase [Mailhella sp.]|uniref:metallophosphoesterase n=1 Tax=Mailhella sp. TaxID=1981029 RepID=UPI003AB1FB97
MRLLLPSIIMAVYTILSLVLPLRTGLGLKAVISVGLLAAGLKYVFYQVVGGGFFRPDLPTPIMLAAEALYASLLMLFVLALAKDILGLALRLLRLFGSSWTMPFTPGIRCALLVFFALTCGVWGTWQAVRVPNVRTVNIYLSKLPAELECFTLVQLSDLHIGPVQKKDWLNQVVNKVNALSPDTVVITGDSIDGLPSAIRQEVTPLASIKAKYGVFGVTGNHEYYYDAQGWIATFRALGIDMLNNEHRVLPGGLVIGGVPDNTVARFGGEGADVNAAFARAPQRPRVLLSHKPSDKGIPSPDVDLQLSGHTHGGLIRFLAPLIGRYNGGYVNGLYQTPQGGLLYVSPGTGLWNGFSCRLGVPSEITRFVLHPQTPSSSKS